MSCSSYKLKHHTFPLSSSLQSIQVSDFQEEDSFSDCFLDMERRLAAFGGTVSLPVGYTFCPTDEIFVAYYLKKKALSRRRNDVEVVPEYDVFSTEPRSLPSGGRVFLGNKFFFFDLRDRVIEENEKRPAGFGEWRSAGEAKDIYVASKNKLVGKRNKLQYWRRKGENFIRTRWIMHEYRLYLPAELPDPSQMSSWAGYKIFLKNEKRSKRARTSSDTENSESDHIESEEEEEVIIELKNEGPIEVTLAEESSNSTSPPSPGSSDSDSLTANK